MQYMDRLRQLDMAEEAVHAVINNEKSDRVKSIMYRHLVDILTEKNNIYTQKLEKLRNNGN